MWKIRELTDQVVNMVMNYTEVEAKVREATNEDPWGPTGPQMQELSQYTYSGEHYHEVMSMLWKRMLIENRTSWRRVYKSLLLLGYMLRNGAERVVTSGKEHLFDLKSLEHYKFVDEVGKDQGINVRNRVKEIVDLLQDDTRLKEERKKARKTKDKYVGLSADDAQMRSRRGGNYSSGGQGNRGSWSPTDSPATSRKHGDSDVDVDEDRGDEFHDDNGKDDSESNGRSSSHQPEKVVKQLKPIGRRIGTEERSSAPARSESGGVKSERDGGGHSSAKAAHGGDDWADFASARNESAQHSSDQSPDDFIEGLTKLHFTKSFKPPPSSGQSIAAPAAAATASQGLDLLNDQFDDFAAAPTAPVTATSSFDPFPQLGGLQMPAQHQQPFPQQQYGMSHSATTPALAPRPFVPAVAASVSTHSAANNLDFLSSLPQSQSMTFQQPAHQPQQQQQMRMPMVQPMIRPNVQQAPNYSSVGPIGYSFQSAGQAGQVRTPQAAATPAKHDWGKSSSGLGLDIDLNLAKNYNKPLSPTMNQLQNFGSPAAAAPIRPPQGGQFGAPLFGAAPWPAASVGLQQQNAFPSSSQPHQQSQQPFGDLL
ncbi:Clathrin interactor 1 [Hypsibius exemplaris]|uniref:Clathrin interactor 1 n=1 Tax=Hypsibius exemplaris TaxID=2072580 RepID=A0A1W0X265_HYPEX|nr:Clathrin interactor 1 [Hypsibius exemplaris]